MRVRATHVCSALVWLLATGCRDDAAPAPAEDTDGADESGEGTAGPDDGADGEETGDEPVVDVPPGGMRRLLAHEYTASIEMLLGPEAAAAAVPPADPTVGDYDAVAAVELPVAPSAVEDHERSAMAVAVAAAAAPDVLGQTVPCVVDGPHDDACYDALARDLGRLLWRRPLEDDEVDGLVALANQAREWGDDEFVSGIEYGLAAMLQSPNFVYVVEVGEVGADGVRRLTPPELATRMSLFLVGRSPDAELLGLADAGTLDDAEGIRTAAWQLLERPEARAQVDRFFLALLELRQLPDKGKDPELFPIWDVATAEAMQQETLRLVSDLVFEQDGDVLDMFDADYTFADARIAAVYGISAPDTPWDKVALPAEQGRAGVLTHPSFLAAHSYESRNSPTRRGLFVQEKILCDRIDPPPPEVDPELPEVEEGLTLREQLEAKTGVSPMCRGCHERMDPIGLSLEHFDAIGARRELDNGQPIDDASADPVLGEFHGAVELAALLRDDDRVPRCMVDNLFSHTLGVAERWQYSDGLSALNERFATEDHSFAALLVELVASPLFVQVQEPR